MWSGGQTNPADLQSQMTAKRTEYDRLSGEQDELQRAQEEVNARYQDAGSKASDAKSTEGQAVQEHSYWENKTRGGEQTLQQTQEQLDQFDLGIQNSRGQLGPMLQRVASAYDLARFYQAHFAFDYYNTRDLGILQRILDNQNVGGAMLVSFHAACMKMNAAALGLHTSVQVTLQVQPTFQVREVAPNKAPDQFAIAASEDRNAAAQQREIDERVRTQKPHYQEQVAKRRNELQEAKAKEKATAADLTAARGNVANSTDAMKDARTDANEAADTTREKSAEVRGVASEMQALGNAKTQQTQQTQQPAAAGARQQPANRQPANQQPANQQPAQQQPAPLAPAPIGK